jgi:phosphoglycerate dehydrogenase-like enzyme
MSTKKFKLFVAMNIPNELIEYLKSKDLDVSVAKTVPVPRQELLESLKDCHAIFCTPSIQLDKELLNCAQNLKVVYFLNTFLN